jgi:NosR/NirI family transcriptional regulator, nitrous oxide reductase regulator
VPHISHIDAFRRRRLEAFAALVICCLWTASAGRAPAAEEGSIRPEELAQVFPDADTVGAFEGSPPAAPVFRKGALTGYLFSTHSVIGSAGYSGKPLDILAGVDLDARITGALLRRHNEPILVIGVSHEDLARYVAGFAGLDLRVRVSEGGDARRVGLPDAIAGATVSSGVIRDAIIRAGRAVAHSRGLLGDNRAQVRLDRETYAPATWSELVADGSIAERRISRGEAAGALSGTGRSAEERNTDALFADVFIGLLTPPRIGENLLGKRAFDRLVARLGVDDQAIFVAANGLYSFKGTGYVRTGRFDRIQVVQGTKTIPLTTEGYENIERLAVEGAPEFREAGVFIIPRETGFDPLASWRLDLLVVQEDAEGAAQRAVFSVDYQLPARYRSPPSAPAAMVNEEFTAPPLWQQTWRERWARVTIISILLAALTLMLVMQDSLAARPRLHRRVRLGFLAVTLVWIGWIAGAQLSVVNVLTFVHALASEFRWEFFLLDPLIFLLWSYVALALLFWGRGVFCGWLCPFGALQELLNEGARRLRFPQTRLPFIPHERLWPLKYLIFIGLFAVSLHSINLAFVGAEVEPFKTAISLKFIRAWPFVLYAVALLVAGLFVERFFCRYVCPLGAALAIPARIRMFEWLKRHPQCGRECAICEHNCPVQAIHPSGEINPNECIYCLKCQTLYYDEYVCPPLVHRRKRRERREELAAGRPVTMPER